jgi:hypothetical protein
VHPEELPEKIVVLGLADLAEADGQDVRIALARARVDAMRGDPMVPRKISRQEIHTACSTVRQIGAARSLWMKSSKRRNRRRCGCASPARCLRTGLDLPGGDLVIAAAVRPLIVAASW